jgi:putative N-acetyltransferase (TIGR04045 family)
MSAPQQSLSPVGTRERSMFCRVARSESDRRAHWAIRQAVFVEEQLVFDGSDQDARDADDRTVHVVGLVDGTIAGAVRLYPLDDDGQLWLGDRLAVLPQFRTSGLGRPLVRFAVSTASGLGGAQMNAHVQVSNVRFFERLGWQCEGPQESYVGLIHQPMTIRW